MRPILLKGENLIFTLVRVGSLPRIFSSVSSGPRGNLRGVNRLRLSNRESFFDPRLRLNEDSRRGYFFQSTPLCFEKKRYDHSFSNSIVQVTELGLGPSSSHTESTARATSFILSEIDPISCVDKIIVEFIGSARMRMPNGTGEGHGVMWGAFYGIVKAIKPHLCDSDMQCLYQSWVDNKTTPRLILDDVSFELIMGDAVGGAATQFSVGGCVRCYLNNKEEMLTSWDSIGSGITYINSNKIPTPSITVADVKSNLDDMLQPCSVGCATPCSRSYEISGAAQWQPGNRHPFFDVKDIFRDLYKQDPSNLEACIWWATLTGMDKNNQGNRTPIFPTKGSSGVASAAWAISEHEGLSLSNLIKYCDDYFSAYIKLASTAASKEGCMAETGPAAAGIAYALTLVRGGSQGNAFDAARLMHVMIKGLTCLPDDGAVRSPCTERDALFAMVADEVSKMVIKQGYICSREDLEREVLDCSKVGSDMPSEIKETLDSKGLCELFPNTTSNSSLSKHCQWHPMNLADDLSSKVSPDKAKLARAFALKVMAFHSSDGQVILEKEELPQEMYASLMEAMKLFIDFVSIEFLEIYYDLQEQEHVTKILLSQNID